MNFGVTPKAYTRTKKFIFYSALIAGGVIGLWHIKLGVKALFVFKENERVMAWICMLTGPISTLPSILFALFKPRLAGLWLIFSGGISFLAFLIWGGSSSINFGIIFEFLIKFSGPMIALGVFFWLYSKPAR